MNLPKYQHGTETEIDYTIAETTGYPGYTASTEEPVASGETITNTQDVTSTDANKAWLNADGTTDAPEGASVVFTLYADGEATDYTVTLDGTTETAPTVTGGYESEAWKASFVNLPKSKIVDGKAVDIVYTVVESGTYAGYTPTSTDPVADGGTITNKQDDTDVNASKIWENADGTDTAPEGATVIFTLYADDEATEYTVTLDGEVDETVPEVTGGYESEAWKAAFVHLPKYKADGVTEIVYTIAETTGYTGYKASTTDPVESGESITNTQLDAQIDLLKIGDGDVDTTLDGVEFELYSVWNGFDATDNVKATDSSGKAIGTIITADGGKAAIGKLLPGTYYLVETKAADGYKMLTDPVTITIELTDKDPGYTVSYKQIGYNDSNASALTPDSDGTYLITVSNSSGVELPNAGGQGTFAYTLTGITMMAAAGLILVLQKKRRIEA